ncbi:5-formyltetrahydrofolate cyclo-ligase [Spongisporangium articulatum]|uniref:5-formyltetrahydrofolate cyclo-ligase n=1 Tax=Spongisporangium articulatum TaxID=3362603 RepID=A0ABW8AQY5_9ACTN
MSDSELTPSKLALRRTVQAQRSRRTADEQAALARRLTAVALELPRLRAATCVALYASMSDEPDTVLLRHELRRRGTRVLLPVIADATTLDWAEDDGRLATAAVVNSVRSIAEPSGPRLGPEGLGAADVVIVPAQAVDTSGTRLGRGRGYYDRALAHAARGALVAALIHDDELLDATTTPVAREAHDHPVQAVITPTRWLYLQ